MKPWIARSAVARIAGGSHVVRSRRREHQRGGDSLTRGDHHGRRRCARDDRSIARQGVERERDAAARDAWNVAKTNLTAGDRRPDVERSRIGFVAAHRQRRRGDLCASPGRKRVRVDDHVDAEARRRRRRLARRQQREREDRAPHQRTAVTVSPLRLPGPTSGAFDQLPLDRVDKTTAVATPPATTTPTAVQNHHFL